MTKNWKHWIYIAWLYLIPVYGNAVTPMIAASDMSSIFLNSDGSVWGTGNVGNYGLGATSPVPLLQLPNITAVASGSLANFALLADGTLWGVGANNSGQLGDGTTQYRSQPQPVPGLSGVKAVSATGHVLALKQDGTVWAWGSNGSGELGDGTKTDRYVPGQVIGLTNVIKISASVNESLALNSDGTVWVWGATCCGAAGNGLYPSGEADPDMYHLIPTQVQNLDQVVAIAAGMGYNMALRADGTVWTWGRGNWGANGTGLANQLLPVQVPGLDQIVAIENRGSRYSLALRADGTLWAWGMNNAGQLGTNALNFTATPIPVPGLTDIIAIAAGESHVLALRRDGTMLAWGSNSNGQLGDGTLQDRAQPLAVVGPGGSGQLNLVQPAPTTYNQLPSGQISLSANSGTAPLTVQATAINANDPDGTIKAYYWTSSDGQQANGPSVNFVFTQAGSYNIHLLIEDNAGGRGSAGQQVVVSFAVVHTTTGPISVNPKAWIGPVSMALTNDGRILTWGGSTMPKVNSIPFANGITGAVDFALGSATLVLLADGSVLGWGMNDSGQVGIGSHVFSVGQPQIVSNLPPVQALAAGSGHSLALTRDGRVFAWGSNNYGQLGVGDNQNRFQPTEVTGLTNVISIAASDLNFSMALKADGTVWAWGINGSNQLGDGTQSPIQISGLAGITKIFIAGNAGFFLKADGTVWATGYPPSVQSGSPGTQSGPRHFSEYDGMVQIAGAVAHVIALKADGTVWVGGSHTSPALGLTDSGKFDGLKQLPGISDAIAVAAGGTDNSMVLRRDGTVLSWGVNFFGQLGDGTATQRLTPVAVVNETANGYLDLIPGTDFELPPSVGVPFFAVTSGSVVVDVTGSVSTTASVNTTTKFNALDVGKSGSVFVTAAVPPGSLVPAQSAMSGLGASAVSASGAISSVSSADTAGNTFALIQLTSSGWQPVVNGQLIPYASGVLGDQLSAQTILNNTDATTLKGAQFCLGYGASAEQMIAVGTMRVVASIPDPNATGAAAPSCIVAGPPVSYSLALPQGWNLLGNSLNQSLSVSSLFNDPNTVTSVWKWDTGTLGWQFYTPQMDATALQTYASGKGYAVLSTINPGEGYWVNAKAQPTLATQSGASFVLTATSLAKGWNLVATGNDITPSAFNTNLKASLSGTGVTTLWAWDNASAKWYFYAPSLEAQGGTALTDYIGGKGYRDFSSNNKTLGNGTGFWVNR